MHDSQVRLEVFQEYVHDVEFNIQSIRRKEKERIERANTPKSTPKKIIPELKIEEIDFEIPNAVTKIIQT